MTLTIVTPETYPVPAVLGGAVSELIQGYSPHLSTSHRIVSPAWEGLAAEEASGAHGRIVRVSGRRGLRRRLEVVTPRRFHRWGGMEHLDAALAAIPRDSTTVVVENRPWFGPRLRAHCPDARLVLHQHNVVPDPDDRLRDFDTVVAVSDHLRDRIRETTGHPSCVTVHNGITPPGPGERAARRAAARDALDLGDRPTLVFVGRLTPEKGADRLLEVLPLIRSVVPEVRLLVVGSAAFGRRTDTRYERSLRRRAQEFGDSVRFLGFVRPDHMPDVWAAADVLCAPGRWAEPFGMVYLEAQVHGVPAVGTRSGGVPEILDDGRTGELLEPGCPPWELASRCTALLLDPDRRAMIAATAREEAVARFSWTRLGPTLEAHLTGSVRCASGSDG